MYSDDNETHISIDGTIIRVPRRIRDMVANYAEGTEDFEGWLIAQASQFVTITNRNKLGSVGSFVRMTCIITTDQCRYRLRLAPKRLQDLRDIIRDRRIVCEWYQNMADTRGLRTAAVAAKRRKHLFFIEVLRQVLIILEDYERMG